MRTNADLSALTAPDVIELARLHRRAFPGFFLSALGEPFLVQFYRGFLDDQSAVTVVARSSSGRLLGAVVGTTEPAGYFRRLLRRRWVGFAMAGGRAIVVRPSAAPRLCRAVMYRGDSPANQSGALLSSICVDPSLQAQGVGNQLIEAWTSRARELGASMAFLTTDAVDNDGPNRFYQEQGWMLTDTYRTREGRPMNRYCTSLAG